MQRKIIFIIGFAVLVLSALWGTGLAAKDPIKDAGILKFPSKMNAPEFMIEDLNGDKWRLSDYRGKVVLLSFWTTW
jgi:cytochrome oxidase Cu insertion factor (SCO1/SenC/PrrC family)